MEIRDPIHGNIEFDETEESIINTKEMQRLRYIKQLDSTYLIFPGANHSRFEHSLGTMQITKELVKDVYRDNFKEFSYVGLLHDIGHGPFSHLSEPLIEKHLKKNHEQIGEEVIRNSEIKDIISNSSMSFDKIMSYFKDAEKIDIVGGALGADRLDYLMRDSHYTGVAYGIIDYERIKKRLVLFKDRVAVTEQGVSGAESILIARYFMYNNVYAHHAKVIANKMLLNAISLGFDGGLYDANELSLMCDDELIYMILNSNVEKAVELVKRFRQRRLFKRAYYHSIKNDIDTEKLEKELIDAGLDRADFVIHTTSFGGSKDNVDVVDRNSNYIGKLAEVSPFVNTLINFLATYRRLLVACDKSNVERVGAIVRKFVG
ncbi:MAG: HD domain-containing protein [Candidatus Micrarchaeales archaeon]